MELGLHAAVPHAVDLELEHEPRALNAHVEREVEVIEFDAFCRRQPREQALGHRVEVCR
jgi:hypothetical protein